MSHGRKGWAARLKEYNRSITPRRYVRRDSLAPGVQRVLARREHEEELERIERDRRQGDGPLPQPAYMEARRAARERYESEKERIGRLEATQRVESLRLRRARLHAASPDLDLAEADRRIGLVETGGKEEFQRAEQMLAALEQGTATRTGATLGVEWVKVNAPGGATTGAALPAAGSSPPTDKEVGLRRGEGRIRAVAHTGLGLFLVVAGLSLLGGTVQMLSHDGDEIGWMLSFLGALAVVGGIWRIWYVWS